MATQVKNIRLYYLGGFKQEHPIISAMGESYHVPPAGDFLEVPVHIARAIIRRNRTPEGQYLFTTDASLVKRQMAVFQKQAEAPEKKFSRTELLEMLNDLDEDIQEDVKVAKRTAKKQEEGV